MKILHVIPFFSPVYGGSAISTYNISRELANRGHEVTIFTSDCQLSREWTESLRKVEVCPFKTLLTCANFYVTPDMTERARGGIESFDLIHLHNYRSFQNIVVHHYARKSRVPYVLQACGSLPRIMTKQRLKWVYDMFFGYDQLRDASISIALSKTEVQQYKDMGVPDGKIAIVPNGIDLEEYNDLPSKGCFRKKFSISEDTRVILFLGRIHFIKGLDFLVKAYAYMLRKFKLDNVLLVIAGSDDGYLWELKRLLNTTTIADHVLFTGPLYGREKLEAYVDADVFVLPSRYETFPNVVLEAYACSRPVIASNVESIPDIVIRGKTGLLSSVDDVQELAGLMSYMLSHPEGAEEMGQRARKLVTEEFSIDKVADSIEALYEEILEEKQAG